MGDDIGFWGLAASGLLVLVTLALSWLYRLGIARDVLIAAGRALVQLLMVGTALHLVVDADDPLILTWVWVIVMIAVAAWTSARRAREVPNVVLISAASYLASATVTLGVLIGLGVFEPTGRAIVPLAGMTIGNSLAATVLVSRRVVAEARDNRGPIEAALALGMTAQQAIRPQLQSALRDALVPQLERTKAVGIIALPGAMVGLILAGVDPVAAVRVQVAVMYLVLGSVTTTATVTAIALTRQLFTPDERLVRLPDPA